MAGAWVSDMAGLIAFGARRERSSDHKMLKRNTTTLQAPESQHHSSTWRTKCDRKPIRREKGRRAISSSTSSSKLDKTPWHNKSGGKQCTLSLLLLPRLLLLLLLLADSFRFNSSTPSPENFKLLITTSQYETTNKSISVNRKQQHQQTNRPTRDIVEREAQAQVSAQDTGSVPPLSSSQTDTTNSDHITPNNNNTDEQHNSNEFKIILTFVYLVIFVIGVCGNVCNCLVIADSRNRYMKTATNYYLFSLSISDLLLLIFGLPHDIVNLWHETPYLFNSFVCISRGWISEASTNASVLVIVAFTVERYLAICHPLRAHTLSRLSRSIKIIIVIWLVASSCALVVAWQFDVTIDNAYVGETGDDADIMGSLAPSATITSASLVGGDSSIGVVSTNDTANNTTKNTHRVYRPMLKCTVIELNKGIFEASVILFFIIPMTLITILYIKLGHRLSQKTTVLKRNRLNRERQLSQRQTHASSLEACSTGADVSLSRSPSSSFAYQTIAMTKTSLAVEPASQLNNANPTNNTGGLLLLDEMGASATKSTIGQTNETFAPGHHHHGSVPSKQQAVRIKVTSTTPAGSWSNINNTNGSIADDTMAVDGGGAGAGSKGGTPAIPAATSSIRQKLCLCCITETIITKPVRSIANGASKLACRKQSASQRRRANSDCDNNRPCLSPPETVHMNNSSNNNSRDNAATKIDIRQPSQPIDGARILAQGTGASGACAIGKNAIEKRKSGGKLRQQQQHHHHHHHHNQGRDLFGLGKRRQQCEKQMIDKAGDEWLGMAENDMKCQHDDEERGASTAPAPSLPTADECLLKEKAAASCCVARGPQQIGQQQPAPRNGTTVTKIDVQEDERTARGSFDCVAPSPTALNPGSEAEPALERRQIVINVGGNGNGDGRICMQQQTIIDESGHNDHDDDDHHHHHHAGDDPCEALSHSEMGPNRAKQQHTSSAEEAAAASAVSVAIGDTRRSLLAQTGSALNNGLLQPKALESECHQVRDKEQLNGEQGKQQKQQNRTRATATMKMKNSDSPPPPAPGAEKSPKPGQAGSELFALNSTVNTSSMKSVIKMLVSVVVMFFICWAPFHAQRLMAIYVVEPTKQQVFLFNLLNDISGISYYISAVANPILYSLFSMRFRQAFRDTFSSMNLCPAFVLGAGNT
uniref:Neuropeptides capa receptor n=1 Tax=Aceria tosichella TaxID=561515 RepID=A0A6G1S996_9ACAR